MYSGMYQNNKSLYINTLGTLETYIETNDEVYVDSISTIEEMGDIFKDNMTFFEYDYYSNEGNFDIMSIEEMIVADGNLNPN